MVAEWFLLAFFRLHLLQKNEKTYSPGGEYAQNCTGKNSASKRPPMAQVGKKVRDRCQECGLCALQWRGTGHFQRTGANKASARGQRPRTCASRVSAVGPKVRTGASKGAEEGKVSADLRQECGLCALQWRGTGHFQPTCASRASAELPQTAARLRPAAPAGTQRSQRRNQRRMIPQVSRSFRCQLCFPPLTSYRSTSVESPSQR